MKIKQVALAILLIVISGSVVAKEKSTAATKSLKIGNASENNGSLYDSSRVETSDFTKLFSEAQVYYKAAVAWNKIQCEPKTGFICTKKECVQRDIKTTITLDKKSKTISRCDDNVCDTYEAEFKQTGIFFNVQTEGPVGTLIRVLGDSRYKEVSTVGLDAYIANGECHVVYDEVKSSEKEKS